MKFLLVSGRYINTARIDAVLLPDSQGASVWYGGRSEPLHARPDEVPAIQQYVREAMA